MKKLRWTLLLILCCVLFPLSAQRLYEIRNKYLRLTVSEKGAEMMNIRYLGKEYLWQGDPKVWANRAPIMFPVCIRFKDDYFVYRGETYRMPRMGLLLDKNVPARISKDSSTVSFTYESSDSVLTQNYPFAFKLNISYRLQGKQLTHTLTLENSGSDTLYFAMGVHPGFQLLLNDTLARGGYEISFSNKPVSLIRTKVNTGLLLHEEEPFLTNEKSIRLDDKRLATTGMFFNNPGIRKIGIGRTNKLPFLYLETGNFPHLNLWSPPGKSFICPEIMVSHHDFVDSPSDITAKSQLIRLAPHKKKSYFYRIVFQ